MDHLSIQQQQPAEDAIKKFGWLQLVLTIVFYIGGMFVLNILLGIAVVIIKPELVNEDATLSTAVLLLIDALTFLLVFFIYKPVRRFLIKAFDASVLKQLRTYGYIALAFIAIFAMQYLLLEKLGIESNNQQNQDLGTDQIKTIAEQWLFFIAVAVITPIKEEMLFRGILYRFLSGKYYFWIGLLVSSIVFGVLHGGLPITASLMGIIFALLYRKTNSLYPPIILHTLWNAFASVGVFL